MARLRDSWSEEYKKIVLQTEKQLGHPICGEITEGELPCTKWPFSGIDRCLLHAGKEELDKYLKTEEVKKEDKPKEIMEKKAHPVLLETRIRILILPVIFLALGVFLIFLLYGIFGAKKDFGSRLQEADEFFNKKNYVKALSNYEGLIEQYSDRTEIPALKRKAEYLRALLKYNKAMNVINGIETGNIEDAYFDIGEYFRINGDFTQAISYYVKLTSQFPESRKLGQGLLNTAKCYYSIGDYYKAIKCYKILLEKYPGLSSYSSAKYQIGYIYQEKLKDIESAVEEYRQYMTDFPEGAEAVKVMYSIGKCYQWTGDYKKVEEVYETIKGKFPYSAETKETQKLLAYIDDVLVKIKEYEASLKTIRRKSEVMSLKYEIARKYYEIENYREALRLFEEVTKKYPKLLIAVESWYEMGNIYGDERNPEKDYQLAKKMYMKVIELNMSERLKITAKEKLKSLMNRRKKNS